MIVTCARLFVSVSLSPPPALSTWAQVSSITSLAEQVERDRVRHTLCLTPEAWGWEGEAA